MPPKASEPKDPTATKRQAAVKARLNDEGGKRLPVKLLGRHIKKIDRLIKAKYAPDQQAVILRLIDDAKCS